jgi:predicted esterase
MKTHLLFGAVLFALLAFVGMTVAAPDQPHMRAAVELLQSAKKSDQPLPMLQAAKKHLLKARPNKKGERYDALEAVNEAIAQATVGKDREKMEQKINHAISQIHSGMAKAK